MSELEVSRDLSLLLAHVGTVQVPSKVKWADFYSHVKVDGERKEFRLYTLLKTNTVHGILVDLDQKANKIEAQTVVNLDQVSCVLFGTPPNSGATGRTCGRWR